MKIKTFIAQIYALLKVTALAGIIMLPVTGEVQDAGQITRVLYNVRDQFSRLTFFVDGSVNCASEQIDGQISLYFPNTSITSPLGYTELEFQTGLIQKTNLEKINNGDAAVTIYLREDAWYTLIRDTENNNFYVYIFPSKMVFHDTSPASVQLFDPISIAADGAVGRTSGNEYPADSFLRAAQIPQLSSPVVLRSGHYRPLVLIFAIITSGVIVIVMTGCFMFIRYLRMKKTTKRHEAESLPGLKKQIREEKQESTETYFDNKNEEADEQGFVIDERESTGETNSVTDIEAEYRRGKGEINLIMKLESDIKQNSLKKKLSKLNKKYASDSVLISDAKKLGLGQGEIKLLRDLEKFRTNKHKKEIHS